MAKMPPSFQFYAADWLTGTAGLSHSSKATFLLMLCFEWIQVDVRFDPPRLSRMIGISEADFARDWAELESKFTIDESGCIRNAKLESIREEVLALSQKRQAAGRKGGSSKAKAKLKQRGKQTPSKGSMKSEVRSLTSKKAKSTTEGIAIAATGNGFQDFWDAYRRKKNRVTAERAFFNAVERLVERGMSAEVAADYIADKAEMFSTSPCGIDHAGKFCPHPASWLNAGSYDEDPVEWDRRDPDDGKPKARIPLSELMKGA